MMSPANSRVDQRNSNNRNNNNIYIYTKRNKADMVKYYNQ